MSTAPEGVAVLESLGGDVVSCDADVPSFRALLAPELRQSQDINEPPHHIPRFADPEVEYAVVDSLKRRLAARLPVSLQFPEACTLSHP